MRSWWSSSLRRLVGLQDCSRKPESFARRRSRRPLRQRQPGPGSFAILCSCECIVGENPVSFKLHQAFFQFTCALPSEVRHSVSELHPTLDWSSRFAKDYHRNASGAQKVSANVAVDASSLPEQFLSVRRPWAVRPIARVNRIPHDANNRHATLQPDHRTVLSAVVPVRGGALRRPRGGTGLHAAHVSTGARVRAASQGQVWHQPVAVHDSVHSILEGAGFAEAAARLNSDPVGGRGWTG